MISTKSLFHAMKLKNLIPSQKRTRLTERRFFFFPDLMVGFTFSFLLSTLSLLLPFFCPGFFKACALLFPCLSLLINCFCMLFQCFSVFLGFPAFLGIPAFLLPYFHCFSCFPCFPMLSVLSVLSLLSLLRPPPRARGPRSLHLAPFGNIKAS